MFGGGHCLECWPKTRRTCNPLEGGATAAPLFLLGPPSCLAVALCLGRAGSQDGLACDCAVSGAVLVAAWTADARGVLARIGARLASTFAPSQTDPLAAATVTRQRPPPGRKTIAGRNGSDLAIYYLDLTVTLPRTYTRSCQWRRLPGTLSGCC